MLSKWTEIEQILSDLIGDLTIAVDVLKNFEFEWEKSKKEDTVRRQLVWRLCIFSLVMNCCKYVELNKKYGKEFKNLIPEHNKVRGKFNEIITQNKSINNLRNGCVAHISDKSKYLSNLQVQEEINKMFGGHYADDFLNWVCPDDIESSDKTKSLVGVIELLRDAVAAKL